MDFDIAMPLTLLAVTLVSMALSKKTETKLKTTLEDKEFKTKDAIVFVGAMATMIFLIVYVRQVSVLLMAVFLFSYSILLFTFGYVFSKNRWYIGIIPPAMFVLLYVFTRETTLWTSYLINIYGLIFAVLITLYIAGLFTWKTTAVFAIALTAMDIILVLVTGIMIKAAEATSSLNLPVLVAIQTVPAVERSGGVIYMRLGLGDFFFAGLLGIQTLKRLGKTASALSAIAMTISFFVFEVMLLNYLPIPFPGTVMIISGWAVAMGIHQLVAKRSHVGREAQV